jgi:pyocin large subunit-like protein
MPRSDGYSLGPYSIQGARVYDDTSSQWTTPDAYKGAVDDPMSQKPYMWNNNNAVSYSDPTGFAPLFNDYVYGDLDDSLLKQSFESGASTSAQQQSTLAQEVPPEEEKEEPNGVPPADANANLWAGGQENMQEHFEKHGDEFPGATIDDYTAIGFGLYYQAEHNPGEPQAEVFIKEAAGLNASQTRYLIYNADTNVFGAYTSEGKIITVFKPKSPDYFFQQRGVEIPSVPLPAIP